MKKIVLYHSNPCEFGGIDTFDYNFCKKFKDKYDITFLYREGAKSTIDRLKNLGIDVQKYKENQIYKCDICILASAWSGYPDTVFAKTGRYIQMVHADYEKSDLIDFKYHKWYKTTEHIGVSEQVCKSFKKLFPKEKITRIYNILDDKQETRPILKLISATRLSKEKGYNRMLELAQILKSKGIKFRWTVFTDLNLYNQRPINMEEFIYMKPSHDLFDYIAEADYGVQLSDTEGYSYFINECLQYGTPVICTNFPSAKESVENGINGYILNMDLSNVDIDNIVNNIPNKFKYVEKCKITDWTKLLNKRTTIKSKAKIYRITAIEDYDDKMPQLILDKTTQDDKLSIEKGQIYHIFDKERANQIKNSGLAKVEEVDISDI